MTLGTSASRLMAALTHFCSLDFVAKILDEDVALLQAYHRD